MKSFARRCDVLLLAVSMAITAGCGQAPEHAAAPAVAARVNSSEITTSQVDYLLGRTPNVTAANSAQARRAILDKLIDDELARQQAVQDKLDKSPAVMQALQLARTEVLAHSYLQKVAARVPKPTETEVRAYYDAHPELFAKRRIFQVDEIVFDASQALALGLRDVVAGARSMQDVAGWLMSRGIGYTESRATRPAEQVALDFLPTLQAMKDGQIVLASADAGRYRVLQSVASTAAPVDEASAAPRIREYLFNRRASDAVAADMKRVRGEAKIVYLGPFVGKVASREREPAAKVQELAQSRQAVMDNGRRGLVK